jgi:N6-adenosine-specific RNA methylase IME4
LGFFQAGGRRRFRTILADPPWDSQQRGTLGAIHHYRLMTLNQIKALPVGNLAEDDAHLWLWTTNAALESAYQVMRVWGFEPRSIMTWTKPRLGLGNYLRNCTEQLLLGTKGRAPIRFKAQPNWLFAPVQDHSHKPEEVYDIIERCSQGPYLELFSRRPRQGWQVWGNEVEPDVNLAGIGPRQPPDPYQSYAADSCHRGVR